MAARSRVVRVQGVGPNHPPLGNWASTMGQRSRADGAESVWLKTEESGYISMSPDEAVELAAKLLDAAVIAKRVNAEHKEGRRGS